MTAADFTPEAVARLREDCKLAAEVMAKIGTFETGQAILKDADKMLEALSARLAEAVAERDGQKAASSMHVEWWQTAERECDRLAAERDRLAAELAEVRAEPVGPSDQRKKYDAIRARILAGKASQQAASDAIKTLCDDNERLAVSVGRQRTRARAAEAERDRLAAELAEARSYLVSCVAMIQHAVGKGRDVFIEPDTKRTLSQAALIAAAEASAWR